MKDSSAWILSLGQWYERVARPLPWRQTQDPYSIWISEVMLQQTQVAAVIPYYHRFLERFPTVQALAASEEQAVLLLWSGLGYYSRARNLRRGAQFLCSEYGGKFPRTREEILKVPGIGPYTAGAILSIAFDLKEALVDGNVQRVFARFFGIETLLHEKITQNRFWDEAARAVDACRSPRIFNQALMELGATVCLKSSPKCGQCPISPSCVAFRKGLQEKLPKRKDRRKPVELWWLGMLLEKQGSWLLRQNQKGEWWADLWDLPRLEFKDSAALEAGWEKIAERLPKGARWKALDVKKHTVTHHRIHFLPYHVRFEKPPKGLPAEGGRWLSKKKIAELPLSSLVKKVLSDLVMLK